MKKILVILAAYIISIFAFLSNPSRIFAEAGNCYPGTISDGKITLSPSDVAAGEELTVTINNAAEDTVFEGEYHIVIDPGLSLTSDFPKLEYTASITLDASGSGVGTIKIPDDIDIGDHAIVIYDDLQNFTEAICSRPHIFSVYTDEEEPEPTEEPEIPTEDCAALGKTCICGGEDVLPLCDPDNTVCAYTASGDMCVVVESGKLGSQCSGSAGSWSCQVGVPTVSNAGKSNERCTCETRNLDYLASCQEGGVWGIKTAIGCIPFNSFENTASFLLKWAIGVGSGVAFFLVIFAGFQIITSQGDPYKLSAGKELLASAILGLVMIIFSVFLLRVIGVNILGIF